VTPRPTATATALPTVAALVGDELRLVEERLASLLAAREPRLTEIANHLIGSGGKRVRPSVTLLVFRACGGDVVADAVDVAVARELIHSASLLHDDIIDGNDMRRGRASARHKFGIGQTLVAGDFLFSRAFQICGRFDAELITWAAEACVALTEGEIMQGRFRHNAAVRFDDYLEIIARKTASLFEVGARTAAYLAGADTMVVEAMARCGRHVGLTFQMVDDLLDVTASDAALGKPVGLDVREENPRCRSSSASNRTTSSPPVRPRRLCRGRGERRARTAASVRRDPPRLRDRDLARGRGARRAAGAADSPYRDYLLSSSTSSSTARRSPLGAWRRRSSAPVEAPCNGADRARPSGAQARARQRRDADGASAIKSAPAARRCRAGCSSSAVRARALEAARVERHRHLIGPPQRAHEDRHHHRHVAEHPLPEPAALEVETAAALRLDHGGGGVDEHRHEAERHRHGEADGIGHAEPGERVGEILDARRREEQDPRPEEELQLQRHAEPEPRGRLADVDRPPDEQWRPIVGTVEEGPDQQRHHEHQRKQEPEAPDVAPAARPPQQQHQRHQQRHLPERPLGRECRDEDGDHAEQPHQRMEAVPGVAVEERFMTALVAGSTPASSRRRKRREAEAAANARRLGHAEVVV
jgi:octaprenyl-diphosphate synthase